MAEDPTDPSNINLRSKGLTVSLGKLHKGCVKDATTKLSIGSIPSTYQSIVYKTDNKKAFGTSQKRFYQKQSCSIMQTNSQDTSTLDSHHNQMKINHNTQGQNAFISKLKRQWLKCPRTPGPTYYYKSNDIKSGESTRKCFTRQTRKKHNVNSRKQDSKPNLILPGPGQYLYDRRQFWDSSYKGWKSSFQTKVNRNGYIPQSISPGPGYYQSNPIQTKNSPKKEQKIELKQQKNVLVQLLKQNKYEAPGPGAYNHQIPNFKPLYQKIKMSRNFMAPIFNGRKRNKGNPSPNLYNVKRIYQDLTPKLIQSTFFMSETKREPFVNKNSLDPTTSSPALPAHKNFHFNIKNEWIY